MKSLLFKINETLRRDKMYYSFILLFFFVGIVLGVFVIKYMNGGDKKDLLTYFDAFISASKEEDINYINLLLNVTVKILLFMIPIIILGLTFFGIPFILMIDLIKGFNLGYTFAFLVNAYSGNGFLLAVGAVLPQNFFYIPAIFGLSVLAMQISNFKFKKRFLKGKGNTYSLKGIQRKLLYILLFMVMGILIEVYLSPSIIKLIVKAI